jgi:hypothetical protein
MFGGVDMVVALLEGDLERFAVYVLFGVVPVLYATQREGLDFCSLQ